MKTGSVRIGLIAAMAAALLIGVARTPSQGPEMQWYKGNLHTHTINSDGDSAPDAVARWYKERRYHFLALTDHNYFTDPQGLNAFLGAKERFLLITGEEVTSGYQRSPVHVNAFRLRSTIEPAAGASVLATVQANVDAIRGAGAVPSLNHPLFGWAVDAQTFSRVNGLKLFEVYNGHPITNDYGGLEKLWDTALSAGREVYGIAVDDAHVFKRFSPDESNPGRGWIQVRANELTQEAILAAVDRGEFYSSTGVELSALERGGGRLSVKMKQQSQERFTTRFVGSGGKTLAEVEGPEAEYRLKDGDGYVRATIRDSNGRMAWVQPLLGMS